jgi:hypothetical protein
MTLAAPARLNRERGIRSTTRLKTAPPPAPLEEAVSAPPAAPSQVVLMVDFSSPEGRTWWAVGLGETLAEAIAFAQDSCPSDTTWQPTRWNDLYGD